MEASIAGKNFIKANPSYRFDPWLMGITVSLIAIGFIAMSSASIELSARYYDDPFFYVWRYLLHLSLGLMVAVMVYCVPMKFWHSSGPVALFLGLLLLVVVLMPGIGREVNGSRRWLALGPLTLQASELAKACWMIYLASYLVRHQQEVRQQLSGFIKPMLVLLVLALLLMAEPDFGSVIVMVSITMGMLYLAGVRMLHFGIVVLVTVVALMVFMVVEPYRLQRLTAFMDPWADQFNTGYQLTQSLIAFGRGGWMGVGLGNSVQKLFYLPDAHTDFVFAIFAEEFGFLGAWLVISLFFMFIVRILHIGRLAERQQRHFGAYVIYGVAFMLGAQVFINIGVNAGLLPTKGLTLPFFSYGGSSLMVCCSLLGIVYRVHRESYEKR